MGKVVTSHQLWSSLLEKDFLLNVTQQLFVSKILNSLNEDSECCHTCFFFCPAACPLVLYLYLVLDESYEGNSDQANLMLISGSWQHLICLLASFRGLWLIWFCSLPLKDLCCNSFLAIGELRMSCSWEEMLA